MNKILIWIKKPIVIISILLVISLGYIVFTHIKTVYDNNLTKKLTTVKDNTIIAVAQMSLGCQTVKLNVPFKETPSSEVKLKEIQLRDITCETSVGQIETPKEPIVNPFVEEVPAPTSDIIPQ